MPQKWLIELVPHWSIGTKCFSTKRWWRFPPNPRFLNFGPPSARASKQRLLEGPSLNEAGLRLRRSLAHSLPFPHTWLLYTPLLAREKPCWTWGTCRLYAQSLLPITIVPVFPFPVILLNKGSPSQIWIRFLLASFYRQRTDTLEEV